MRNHYRSYRVPHFSPLLGEVGPLTFVANPIKKAVPHSSRDLCG
jgi:hypothetical protein